MMWVLHVYWFSPNSEHGGRIVSSTHGSRGACIRSYKRRKRELAGHIYVQLVSEHRRAK